MCLDVAEMFGDSLIPGKFDHKNTIRIYYAIIAVEKFGKIEKRKSHFERHYHFIGGKPRSMNNETPFYGALLLRTVGISRDFPVYFPGFSDRGHFSGQPTARSDRDYLFFVSLISAER